MMRRLLKLCTLTTLITTPLVAQYCSSPCWDACDWGADFVIGVDALYWKPLHCDYVFGRRDATVENTTVSNISSITADYDWGVRAYAGYVRDCNFIDVSYTWFQTHDASLPGDGLLPVVVNTPMTHAIARLFFQYQNVDFRLGQILHKGRSCNFHVFADARWVFMNQRRQFNSTFFDSDIGVNRYTVVHKSTFSGAGIGVGMGGEFSIWSCFSGFGRLTALSLIGNRQTPIEFMQQINRIQPPIVQVAKFRSNTCIIPAIDVRLGLTYRWDCCWLSTVWEVGYEIDYYFQALNTVNEQSNALTNNAFPLRSCKNIGFAGPYAAVKIVF